MLCPRCGQQDSVQSVRSIYEQGTSDSQTSGTAFGYGGHGQWGAAFVGMNGTSQTRLAQRMSPPTKPLGGIHAFVAMLMCGFIAWLAYQPVGTIMGFLTSEHGEDHWISITILVVLVSVIALAGFWALVTAMVVIIRVANVFGCLRGEIQQWHQKTQAWNNSHYCHRCGCQF